MLTFEWLRPETKGANSFGELKLVTAIKERGKVEVGFVKSHFLDSGSFTLKTVANKYAKKHGCGKWAYYDTPEFWAYVDDYAAFLKKHKIGIDYYANVDAIYNPKLSWRNLKYLEKKHGLRPVPVLHYGADMQWVHRHLEAGYSFIGIGGIASGAPFESSIRWMDNVFHVICDTPNRVPKIKVHGFGVTSYDIMLRYPWWSVDSSTWVLCGAFGGILVPHKRKGKYVFTENPYSIKVSDESPDRKSLCGKHFDSLKKAEQAIVLGWLEEIGVPLGGGGSPGVRTDTYLRRVANVRFFSRFEAEFPPWPRPFVAQKRPTWGSL